MDIIALINRKQTEADAIAGSIANQQADLDTRLAVISHLHDLRTQSLYSADDVTYLFEQSNK